MDDLQIVLKHDYQEILYKLRTIKSSSPEVKGRGLKSVIFLDLKNMYA